MIDHKHCENFIEFITPQGIYGFCELQGKLTKKLLVCTKEYEQLINEEFMKALLED